MKTLYIHIGTSKTGSTALQAFCSKNREILEKNGFCYPDFPVKYDYVGNARNGHFLYSEDMNQKDSVFWDCMNIIREAFETGSNVILSDERIWRLNRKWHTDFYEIIQKEGYSVKLIMYLRRQDEYVISSWNQFVKRGYFVQKSKQNLIEENLIKDGGAWETFLKDIETKPYLNYLKIVRKLEAVYGKKNILVKRYDRRYFPGNSIYADFMQTLGLELTEEYNREQTGLNPSLSPNTAEIQRVLNTILDGDTNHYFYFFNKILTSFSGTSQRNYSCSMFSKEEAMNFMKRYQKGNRRIAKEYFGEEELFYPDEKTETKWVKDNPYMQDDLIRFIGTSLMQILEENRKMKEANKKMQGEIRQLKTSINKIKHPVHTIGEKLRTKQSN